MFGLPQFAQIVFGGLNAPNKVTRSKTIVGTANVIHTVNYHTKKITITGNAQVIRR